MEGKKNQGAVAPLTLVRFGCATAERDVASRLRREAWVGSPAWSGLVLGWSLSSSSWGGLMRQDQRRALQALTAVCSQMPQDGLRGDGIVPVSGIDLICLLDEVLVLAPGRSCGLFLVWSGPVWSGWKTLETSRGVSRPGLGYPRWQPSQDDFFGDSVHK